MRAFAFSAIFFISLASPAFAQVDSEMHDMNHATQPVAPSPSPDPMKQEADAQSTNLSDGTETADDEAVGNEPAPDPPPDHAADGDRKSVV